jgi:antitoxin MazE
LKKTIKPKYVSYMPKGVPKDQRWFWTEAWQKGEREADENIRKGRVKSYDSVEDFIKAMDGKRRKKKKK